MTGAILTERLQLASVGTCDVASACDLLHMPELRRYLCDDALVAREAVAAWIAESVDPSSVTRYWRITTAADGFVGLIGLKPPSTATLALRAIGWRSLELVVALDPRHWGRGLAAEAIAAVVEHGLSDGVTFAVLGAVDEPNERSHRLMVRCGFAELGRVAGPVYPIVVYERSV